MSLTIRLFNRTIWPDSASMPDSAQHFLLETRARGDWVRLRTLVTLRWMAITGQIAAVLIAALVLGYDLPLPACALVISASVSFNLVAHMVHPSAKRLSERGTLTSLFFRPGSTGDNVDADGRAEQSFCGPDHCTGDNCSDRIAATIDPGAGPRGADLDPADGPDPFPADTPRRDRAGRAGNISIRVWAPPWRSA